MNAEEVSFLLDPLANAVGRKLHGVRRLGPQASGLGRRADDLDSRPYVAEGVLVSGHAVRVGMLF